MHDINSYLIKRRIDQCMIIRMIESQTAHKSSTKHMRHSKIRTRQLHSKSEPDVGKVSTGTVYCSKLFHKLMHSVLHPSSFQVTAMSYQLRLMIPTPPTLSLNPPHKLHHALKTFLAIFAEQTQHLPVRLPTKSSFKSELTPKMRPSPSLWRK